MTAVQARFERWSRAPDGKRRPDAPFGRGPLAARVLARVIDAAAAAGGRLPARVAHGLARVGGNLEWALRPGKRRVLATNLAHAVGSPADSKRVRRLVRTEIVNEARRSADLLWAIGRPQELLSTIDVVGAEHLSEATWRGRGVVLAGLHVGGWEVAGAVPAGVLSVPTTVIVADNWLAWAMQHVRAAEGLRVVYRSAPAIAAARVLQRGEALLILGEDASGADPRRYRVRFCDGEACLPTGVVVLARLTGAAIVPFVVVPVGRRRWRVVIDAPIDAPAREAEPAEESAVLQLVADRWSSFISTYPEQWAASFPITWTGGR